MIKTYATSGDKTWIDVTVTIDGVTYEHAGARLKGNSSLFGLSLSYGGFEGRGGSFPDGEVPYEVKDQGFGEQESLPDGEVPDACFQALVNLGSQLPSFISYGVIGPGLGYMPDALSKEKPEKLPWLIRLNRFVKGQKHQGYADIVIRSNFTETSLNEAVSLDLLERSGLASQAAAHVRFRANGGDPALRLMIEHPSDDAWQDRNFSAAGALYKAESTGDWSYRGDAPAAYDEVFDQEGGKKVADLKPLIEFLKFINEADDTTFSAELPERLDVESFAIYLAMMELVQNWDDIDGPGNNAYLWWDAESARFTVVPWDMNLTFDDFVADFYGDLPDGYEPPDGGESSDITDPPDGYELPEGFEVPEECEPPEGVELPYGYELPQYFEPPEGFEVPEECKLSDGYDLEGEPSKGSEVPEECNFFETSNPLVKQFHANTEFESLYQKKLAELKAELFDSQAADKVLAARVAVLVEQATDLVDADTIRREADVIAQLMTSSDQ
ncbi:CotH kinase family protein [Candidatus Poriferisocius sp.]|uniref:CotH kinase family protein n=1 Tax=Candidatus Poriferisocius sp. TaxID=3101276 RepID=UPI003B0110CD